MFEPAAAGDHALRRAAQPRGGRGRDGERVQGPCEAVLADEGESAGGFGELGLADGAGREEKPDRVRAVRGGVHGEPQRERGSGVPGEDERCQGTAGVRDEVEAVRGSHPGGHQVKRCGSTHEGD